MSSLLTARSRSSAIYSPPLFLTCDVSILFLVPTFSPFCKFSEYHAANLSHQNTLIPLARLMEKNKDEENFNTKIWKIDYVCVSNQNSEDQDEEWKMIFESLLS
jgi:hypothetical protein